MATSDNRLGKMLKGRRLMMAHTLSELAEATSVSQSYLGRIERGERFPSASVLRRIAQPLGFTDVELFTAAGYLPSTPNAAEQIETLNITSTVNAYVASMLSAESVTTQLYLIGILNIIKAIGKDLSVQASDHVKTSN